MSRTRLTLTLLLIAAFAATAAFVLTPPAAANGDPTPLEAEPKPLNNFTTSVDIVYELPDECTPLTDGYCLERVPRWICPAGLSDDAKDRKLADLTYNEAIAAPDIAYLDTHCANDAAEPITIAGWNVYSDVDAPPFDPFTPCVGAQLVVDLDNNRVDCAPLPTPTPTPTAPPAGVPVPVPAFTG